jgi:hypothetical protein
MAPSTSEVVDRFMTTKVDAGGLELKFRSLTYRARYPCGRSRVASLHQPQDCFMGRSATAGVTPRPCQSETVVTAA